MLWLARANEKGGGGGVWTRIVMYEDPFRRQLYVPFSVLCANKEKSKNSREVYGDAAGEMKKLRVIERVLSTGCQHLC